MTMRLTCSLRAAPEPVNARFTCEWPRCRTRTPFASDRDRIIHTSAFRRLKEKTQVFVAHEGDLYRTRLTHSLEVSQIARSLAAALGLDADLAETIALADALGVDPALFFQAIEGGPLDLPYLRMKGQAMTSRDFTPSFRLALAAKDARLVTDAAWQHGVDLPLLDAVAGRLGEAVPEHGDKDISATYLLSAPDQTA